MFKWLRYFPLALSFRENSKDYVIPHGPLFPQLRKCSWRIGGSRFRFSAPWANAVYGFSPFCRASNSYSSKEHDVLACRLAPENSVAMPNNRWQASLIYSRQWCFVGPWFSGDYCSLKMTGVIYGQPHLEDFKGTSFFHPRVFESAVADFLSSYFGHEKNGRKSAYRGPLNWKVIQLSESVQAASFDIFSEVNGSLKKYIIFPVSHDRFISISFSGIYENERRYDQAPVINLMRSITESFRLEVGLDMQAQWREVSAYCTDMSLTSEYGELRWPVKLEDVGKPIGFASRNADKEELSLSAKKLLLKD